VKLDPVLSGKTGWLKLRGEYLQKSGILEVPYSWAEVLSADVFAEFEEKGINNPDVARRLMTEIFEVGGSRPMAESFKAFRGREPSTDALLRHSGMAL